jgi:hypothetical protein
VGGSAFFGERAGMCPILKEITKKSLLKWNPEIVY